MGKKLFKPKDGSHIHRADDERGIRSVFVNGGLVPRCIFADEQKGLAVGFYVPHRRNKKTGELKTRRHRGKVTVKWLTK